MLPLQGPDRDKPRNIYLTRDECTLVYDVNSLKMPLKDLKLYLYANLEGPKRLTAKLPYEIVCLLQRQGMHEKGPREGCA